MVVGSERVDKTLQFARFGIWTPDPLWVKGTERETHHFIILAVPSKGQAHMQPHQGSLEIRKKSYRSVGLYLCGVPKLSGKRWQTRFGFPSPFPFICGVLQLQRR